MVSGEDLTVYEYLVTKLKTEIEQLYTTHLKEMGRKKKRREQALQAEASAKAWGFGLGAILFSESDPCSSPLALRHWPGPFHNRKGV